MLETCTLECIDKCQKALYHCSVLLPESLSSCLPCPFGAFTVSPEFRPFTVMEYQGFSTSIKLHSVLYLIFTFLKEKASLVNYFSALVRRMAFRFLSVKISKISLPFFDDTINSSHIILRISLVLSKT